MNFPQQDDWMQNGEQFKTMLSGLSQLTSHFTKEVLTSFTNVKQEGKSLSDFLRSTLLSFSKQSLKQALSPLFSSLAQAGGQAMAALFSPKVTPFAKGGVFSTPQMFPMRGGLGVLGEAGPEAIMPLSRTNDGQLGVRVQEGSGRSVQVHVQINSPDLGSFQKSQAQISALLAQSVRKGMRGL